MPPDYSDISCTNTCTSGWAYITWRCQNDIKCSPWIVKFPKKIHYYNLKIVFQPYCSKVSPPPNPGALHFLKGGQELESFIGGQLPSSYHVVNSYLDWGVAVTLAILAMHDEAGDWGETMKFKVDQLPDLAAHTFTNELIFFLFLSDVVSFWIQLAGNMYSMFDYE